MKTDALVNLGLSEIEAKLYLALLGLGGSRASAVARTTGIKRTTVYAILKNLANQGFVTMYLRGSTQLYYAERPNRIKNTLNKKMAAFTDLIPQLEAMTKTQGAVAGLRSIESLSELKHFYENVLTDYARQSYCIIGNRFSWQDLDQEFFTRFRRLRAKANIVPST